MTESLIHALVEMQEVEALQKAKQLLNEGRMLLARTPWKGLPWRKSGLERNNMITWPKLSRFRTVLRLTSEALTVDLMSRSRAKHTI